MGVGADERHVSRDEARLVDDFRHQVGQHLQDIVHVPGQLSHQAQGSSAEDIQQVGARLQSGHLSGCGDAQSGNLVALARAALTSRSARLEAAAIEGVAELPFRAGLPLTPVRALRVQGAVGVAAVLESVAVVVRRVGAVLAVDGPEHRDHADVALVLFKDVVGQRRHPGADIQRSLQIDVEVGADQHFDNVVQRRQVHAHFIFDERGHVLDLVHQVQHCQHPVAVSDHPDDSGAAVGGNPTGDAARLGVRNLQVHHGMDQKELVQAVAAGKFGVGTHQVQVHQRAAPQRGARPVAGVQDHRLDFGILQQEIAFVAVLHRAADQLGPAFDALDDDARLPLLAAPGDQHQHASPQQHPERQRRAYLAPAQPSSRWEFHGHHYRFTCTCANRMSLSFSGTLRSTRWM